MNFSERPASEEWAVLKYKGQTLAEVWFKPEGEPNGLTFRIPRDSFHIPGVGQRLTAENLLKTVGIAAAEVESWRHDGGTSSDAGGMDAEFRRPLAPPPEATHLHLSVSLKPPTDDPVAPDVPEEMWQHIASRWKAILVLEANIETLRIGLEGLRTQMEDGSRKVLSSDEKVHALNADVAVWNKAKSRVLYSLPKVKEFIHRATWAKGNPERKKLEEMYESHIRPRIPFPGIDRVAEELENLLKDRQVMAALGVSVQQECNGVSTEVQGALRTLQGNAAANANKKRGATVAKGKSF